ncbi:hypothetical protein HK099_005174 [Clydaea vesicula]|uniref:PPM-type phosphatase domain-containing protein n=1 Tax=Clydaea vesicula TaxID=447962 RepID=A0AAD5TZP2_9FUNG|nr:hypothetical protein HK099_005174 [Clydaea vesicula]
MKKLSKIDQNLIINANSKSKLIKHNNDIYTLHSNYLKSNNPIEDNRSENYSSDKFMLGVFDGHGGWECASVLSNYLNAYVSKELRLIKNKKSSNKKEDIINAIKTGFNKLDADILKGGFENKNYLEPALSGSCAVLLLMDGHDVYVANTGDCRAVLGKQNEDGMFEAVPLSVDQGVDNLNEVKRLEEEHPGLMPSRAFGDAVTAEPVVTHYKITPPKITVNKKDQKVLLSGDLFLILASDGLWDDLSNEESVKIMQNYLHSNKFIDTFDEKIEKNFVFEDLNASTLLIKNSLHKNSKGDIGKLLSIPYPKCRNYRDDVTVEVLFFFNTNEFLGVGEEGKVTFDKDTKEADLKLANKKIDRINISNFISGMKSKL